MFLGERYAILLWTSRIRSGLQMRSTLGCRSMKGIYIWKYSRESPT